MPYLATILITLLLNDSSHVATFAPRWERTLAARIGVNHHTVNRWLKDAEMPDERNVGVSRILPQTRRLPVRRFTVARLRQVNAPTDLAQLKPSHCQTVIISLSTAHERKNRFVVCSPVPV